MRTFGEELKHFALTVDIIEQDKFEEIFSMPVDYLKKRVHTTKVCLLQQGIVEGRIGLYPRYGNIDFTRYGAYSIRDENEQIVSLTAFAYDYEFSIWVIPEDEEGDLQSSNKYIELLENIDTSDFPKYRKVYEGTCRTLISIPLTQQGNRFGILFFESEQIIKPTKKLEDELKNISYALGILFLLLDADKLRRNNTKEAINNLKEAPQTVSFHNYLFLAYSKEADQKVISIIRRILENEYRNIEIIDWDKMRNGGKVIMEEIITSINEAQYGIFYFSELDKETNQYRDNPNVLFEAGMIYALIKQKDTLPKHWIPIREKQSTNIPFDFAGNRILFVPRDDKGVREENFSHELAEMLKQIIDHD